MKRTVLLAIACLLLLSACAPSPPDGGEVISASVTEYREPETAATVPETTSAPETSAYETEENQPPETEETEPEDTKFVDVIPLLPAHVLLEVSEKVAELCHSYTRKTSTLTEIEKNGEVTLSEINSELLMSNGNASFRRTADNGYEEYFLIDGFLCYGGQFGNYRFGGYNISSFSELAGNYFSLHAFEDGVVEPDGDYFALKFDKLTEQGLSEIAEMLALPDGYEIEVTKSEYLFVIDSDANMQEKKLTLEATVISGGEAKLSFRLISHTEQTGINETNDLALPAMTSYVFIPDPAALILYESALIDIESFFGSYQAFELTEADEIVIGGEVDRRITEKTEYAYAKKIGATFEKTFSTGTGTTRVLTHFNRRRAFSQINGGSIFVDTTFNAKNLESTLTAPFSRAWLSFSAFARIEDFTSDRLTFALSTDGKIMLAREALLAAGIYAESVSVVSCDEARAYISFDSNGKISSIGFNISAKVTADGKTYTFSRTHTLDVTQRGSAKVKVIFIEVDEEEEEE